MDQLGLKQKDLENFIGQKSKVSEVMNRKRPLSFPMIRSLSTHLGIPAAVLVREIPLSSPKDIKPSRRKRKAATAS